ncbi:MAG: hypothetical protein AAF824_12000 [Bacteroidota bacterium]
MENRTSAENPLVASRAKRIIAYLVDAILVSIVGGFFLHPGLAAALSAAYMLTRDALPFLDGQSIGKKMVNIRAVKEEGMLPLTGDWETSIKRNILLAIPVVGPLAELIVFLASEDGKRLGDQWFHTTVILEEVVGPKTEEPVISETDL